MNTEPRTDLLILIAELSRRYPSWRLGQLVVASWAADQEIWDVEVEQLLAAARAHLQQFEPVEPTARCRT